MTHVNLADDAVAKEPVAADTIGRQSGIVVSIHDNAQRTAVDVAVLLALVAAKTLPVTG